jgi:hypothetical protein
MKIIPESRLVIKMLQPLVEVGELDMKLYSVTKISSNLF